MTTAPLWTSAAAAAVVLAACSTGPETVAPPLDGTPTPGPTASGSASPSEPEPTSAPSPVEDRPPTAFETNCTLQAPGTAAGAITLAYPPDWDRSDACDAFDPDEVVEGTDTVAIVAKVQQRSFAQHMASIEQRDDVEQREHAVVDGRQAVRDRVETELGPMVIWRVDLDVGPDETGGVLQVFAHAGGLVTPGIADQMVLDARLAAGDDEPTRGATIVGRSEGGDQPWTALLTAEECVQLYGLYVAAEPASEACLDESTAEVPDERLRVALVQFDVEHSFAVGLAGGSVTAVRAADGTVHRTVPTAGGRRGVAFAAQVGDEVELLAGDGSVIAGQTMM